jgi:phosphate transport system substrate-binding protein
MKILPWIHSTLFCWVIASQATPAQDAGAQLIRITGSDTLGAKLVPMLAEGYKAKHPQVRFEIAAEGSASAFAALATGDAEIGMSTRRVRDEEMKAIEAKGSKVVEIVACHDLFVVVVNKDNPIKGLSKKQVESIFTGDVTDWSEVGGGPGAISIFTPNGASASYRDWQVLAMNRRNYAPGSRKIGGSTGAFEVASNKHGIACVGLLFARGSGIRGVPMDGVAPLAENRRKYPYVRPCYYYLPEDSPEAVKDFVAYAKGEEGRKIAEKIGFVPD